MWTNDHHGQTISYKQIEVETENKILNEIVNEAEKKSKLTG